MERLLLELDALEILRAKKHAESNVVVKKPNQDVLVKDVPRFVVHLEKLTVSGKVQKCAILLSRSVRLVSLERIARELIVALSQRRELKLEKFVSKVKKFALLTPSPLQES